MPQKSTIRPATVADIEKIYMIEESAGDVFGTLPLAFLETLPNELPPGAETFYLSMIASGESWMICVDEEAVGFICTGDVPGESCLHIYEFDVAREFQGKGLGSKLLQFVIDRARDAVFSRITLTTFIDVPWNAPWYRKFGFVLVEEPGLDIRLRKILQNEADIGLPQGSRCAMVLSLL